MKKMLTSVLSAILCISCLSASMTVFAETSEPAVLIESNMFTYVRETEHSTPKLTIHDDNFQKLYVVAGIVRRDDGSPVEYFLDGSNVSYQSGESGWWAADEAESVFGRELVIGDVISCSGFGAYEIFPPILFVSFIGDYEDDPNSKHYIKYLGKGTELFGDDFKYVICEMCAYMHETLTREIPGSGNSWYFKDWYESLNLTIEIGYGDANADGKVNVMDVINVNRNLMVGAPLTAYGTLAADVDKNGTVDAADSLNMLKSIVGLVDLAELG